MVITILCLLIPIGIAYGYGTLLEAARRTTHGTEQGQPS